MTWGTGGKRVWGRVAKGSPRGWGFTIPLFHTAGKEPYMQNPTALNTHGQHALMAFAMGLWHK
jgi:hypothetical protein